MKSGIIQENFNKLLLNSRNKIVSFLRSKRISDDILEDVIQRASITMWNKFETFQHGTDFTSWAISITFNELRNFLRKSKRHPVIYDENLFAFSSKDLLTQEIIFDSNLFKLNKAIESLDSESKKLINSYLQGFEIKEIAKKDGKAAQTYYNKFLKIKKKISESILSLENDSI